MSYEDLEIGDLFNETDSDTCQRVLRINEKRDPPTALCRSIKQEEDSSETEQEYSLEYVKNCTTMRKEFVNHGFNKLDVYDIYKLSKKQLKHGLQLARQTTRGTKTNMRDRLMHYLNIYVVPSDAEDSSDETDPEMPDTVEVKVEGAGADESEDEGAGAHESSEDEFIQDYVLKNAGESKKKTRLQTKAKKKVKRNRSESSDLGEDADDDSDSEHSEYQPSPEKASAKKRSRKTREQEVTASSASAIPEHLRKQTGHNNSLANQEQELADSRVASFKVKAKTKKHGGKTKSKSKKRNVPRKKKPTIRKKKSKSKGKGQKKKLPKHHAVWHRVEYDVTPTPRGLPEHCWRSRPPARNTCDTPYSTFRKVFLTDELLDFALQEFNHYPKTLAARRTRPHYVPARYQWPPKWVNDTGRDGPMVLNKKQYLKYIMILYLLGVKHLNNTNLDDMFSNDPILREEWLCKVTNRRDFGRFLRQVQARQAWTCRACVLCWHRWHVSLISLF